MIAGLKKHLTPILAGLLEVNQQKMWTFDKFFGEVTKLLDRKKIHIFFVNNLSPLRVYLDKSQVNDVFCAQSSLPHFVYLAQL